MSVTEEWHADIHITEALVRSCLQEQFPSLMPLQEIKHIDEGWDNKVFLVNQKIIFRFPRRKVAVELIECENKILTKLPRFANIAAPIPKYMGHPSLHYPYSFQGYDMIKGMSGHQTTLSVADRTASITIFAEFLKQLHRIDEAQALVIGAEPQVFDRTIVSTTVDTLNNRIAKIDNVNKNCLQQEIAVAQKLVLPDGDNCLVHGDLDCRHLIFDDKKLTGIIDWGDIGINNKSVDLAVVWSFYPSSCHPQFLESYGAVDSVTWQYARFLGLYNAFTLMLYGKDIGDTLLVTEAIAAVKRINANLLID